MSPSLTLLASSSVLAHLYLVDCALPREAFLQILEAAIANTHGVRLWLEFSSNDLGDKGATEAAELLSKHPEVTTIHTLILNNNNIGPDGIAALCKVGCALVMLMPM
jgi:hypothetical protein